METRTLRVLACAAVAALVSLPSLAAPRRAAALRAAGSPCSSSARAASRACDLGAQSDYWLAVGICDGFTGADGAGECLDDAKESFAESREECGEQFDARLEVCELLGETRYAPDFDPARFVDPDEIGDSVAANPYFPLVVGTEWVYRDDDETVTVTVLPKSKLIEGVRCRVVLDVVEVEGTPVEITDDWFAQDVDGNVWYCGESTREHETFPGDDPVDAELTSVEGSFKTGRDGAQPGILMLAHPAVGAAYREEGALGVAEDVAQVVSTNASESVPAASCAGTCVVTRNFQALSPGGQEHKYYAPGIGLILEIGGGGSRVELVSFSTP